MSHQPPLSGQHISYANKRDDNRISDSTVRKKASYSDASFPSIEASDDGRPRSFSLSSLLPLEGSRPYLSMPATHSSLRPVTQRQLSF